MSSRWIEYLETNCNFSPASSRTPSSRRQTRSRRLHRQPGCQNSRSQKRRLGGACGPTFRPRAPGRAPHSPRRRQSFAVLFAWLVLRSSHHLPFELSGTHACHVRYSPGGTAPQPSTHSLHVTGFALRASTGHQGAQGPEASHFAVCFCRPLQSRG